MSTIRALRIPADADVPVETFDLPTGTSDQLDALQAEVGGYIEAVHIDVLGVPLTLWINEDGKGLGLPYNLRATVETIDHLMPGDHIVGNAVLTGGYDDEGRTLALPEWVKL